jgi:hypothetical protein
MNTTALLTSVVQTISRRKEDILKDIKRYLLKGSNPTFQDSS